MRLGDPLLPHRAEFSHPPPSHPPSPPPPLLFSDKPWHAGDESVFLANLAEIRAHNADKTQSWKKGVNQFSGMTKGS